MTREASLKRTFAKESDPVEKMKAKAARFFLRKISIGKGDPEATRRSPPNP